jgi:SAM-dependent methyltransferase
VEDEGSRAMTDEKTAALPALCPVCHHTVAVPFFDGGAGPLATLGWPRTAQEAKDMPQFPLDYVQCPSCTHVWNRSFTYAAIPYEKNPNRMFNAGGMWRGHLALTGDLVLQKLPASPTVIEIGCGEGHFLRGLAQRRATGRFMGFDPNATAETGRGVEFHARYFRPLADVPQYQPDAVIIRHVLEHLTDPSDLIEQLAWSVSRLAKPVCLFAEMPCIDRVLQTGRLSDFYFEHPSQFTTESFRTLLERAGDIELLEHGY